MFQTPLSMSDMSDVCEINKHVAQQYLVTYMTHF